MNWQSAFTVLALTLALGTNVTSQQVKQPDVREYIRYQPIHGYSYRELSTLFDSTAVPALIEVLNSDADEEYWSRAASLLGVVGDERTVGVLITLIEKGGSPSISRAQNNARSSAMWSLGYLINRTGSERALDYLIEGLTPKVWRERNVIGVVPYRDSYEEYDLLLSTYAVFGLSMSGHPRAGEALRDLLRSPTPEQLQFRDAEEDVVTQWLEVHDLVAERGLAGMEEYYETQRWLRDYREAPAEGKRRMEEGLDEEDAELLREAQESRP